MNRLGDIAYHEAGAGLPVVILHGGWLDHRHMEACLDPILSEAQGLRRIYLDMPGHGASPGEGVDSYQDALDRLVAFTRALLPEGPLLIVGESRGGYFARALAQAFRDRLQGLLLIVPAREPRPAPASLAEMTARIEEPGLAESLPEPLRARLPKLAVRTRAVAEAVAAAKDPPLSDPDRAFQDRVEARYLFDDDPDLSEKRLGVPVLILLGRQDDVVGYRPMLERIGQYPFASVAVLDCAGHSLPFERPALFRALVEDWLDRVRTAGPGAS